jgi:hypothetical protein
MPVCATLVVEAAPEADINAVRDYLMATTIAWEHADARWSEPYPVG